jgi:hypothetical protein
MTSSLHEDTLHPKNKVLEPTPHNTHVNVYLDSNTNYLYIYIYMYLHAYIHTYLHKRPPSDTHPARTHRPTSDPPVTLPVRRDPPHPSTYVQVSTSTVPTHTAPPLLGCLCTTHPKRSREETVEVGALPTYLHVHPYIPTCLVCKKPESVHTYAPRYLKSNFAPPRHLISAKQPTIVHSIVHAWVSSPLSQRSSVATRTNEVEFKKKEEKKRDHTHPQHPYFFSLPRFHAHTQGGTP